MTKRLWKIGVLALLATFLLAGLRAPAADATNPTTMSFQGKVVNANGTNVTDGSYSFVFKLYTASSGGSAVWTESDSLSVSAGVFQVNLGASCPFFTANACNSSTPIDFSTSSSLYLGITFNSDPAGEMTPRVQLQSVPYSFYADNTGKLGGIAASSYAQLSPSGQQTGNINVSGSGTFANGLVVGSQTVITSTDVLQNVTANTSILTAGTLGTVRGGTGLSSFTNQGILYATSTSALGQLNGTSGQILMANASGQPLFTTVSGDATLSSTGVLTIGAAKVTNADLANSSISGSSTNTNLTISSSVSLGGTLTVGFANSPSFSGSVTAGTGLIATTGGLTVSAGGAAITGDLTDTGNVIATGRHYSSHTTGTNGQGFFVRNGSSTPIASFQGLDTGTNSFGFLGVNKYYNGTAWVDDGQSRVGSSFQIQDNTFNFYQFDTAANFHSRLVLNASGNVGIGQDVSPSFLLDVQGGDINTSANVRTGGTTRLDNAGNLTNIGNITATGNTTFSNAGAGNDIAITSQDAINLTTGASGLSVSTNGAAAATAINVTDGTNTLAKIVDAGTYGELQLGVKSTSGNDASQCAAAGDVGKIYVNSSDKAVFACTASGAWEQLDNARVNQSVNAGTFTVSTTNTLVDSVTITPTTANSDVLLRYNAEISLGCTGLGCTNPTVVVKLVRGTTCAGTVIDTQNHTATGLATTTLGDTLIDTTPTGAGVVNTYVICAQRTAGSGTITNTITGRSLIAEEVNTTGADYAETYYSANEPIEPGTVVVGDPSIDAGVKASTSSYQNGLMGVVSTSPGQVLADTTNSGTPVIIALAGRVPVKVSTENGPINVGDYLTSSSAPGVAMRATKAGNVIGTAMASYSANGVGSIMTFVHNGQFNGVLPLNSDGTTIASTALLNQLITGQAQPNQTVTTTDLRADTIAADVEVVAPSIVSDKLQTNTIVIGPDGINFTDEQGNVVASIGHDGSFQNQPAAPTTPAASSNQITVTAAGFSLVDPSGKSLAAFDGSGNANFAGDLNFANAVASGGLQIGGNLNVAGLSTFQKLATFFAKTVFRQDVEFQGHVTVANDTAGYALLRKGEQTVHVSFQQAYDAAPVVTANIVTGQFASATVDHITSSGFDIKLAAPASEDTTLDWTAFAVTNPQTATNPLQTTEATAP